MPHRETIRFSENTKEFMEASDDRSVPYRSEKQKEVAKHIRAAERARAAINEIQQSCDDTHNCPVKNIARLRQFQCQDCGLMRGKPFGAPVE